MDPYFCLTRWFFLQYWQKLRQSDRDKAASRFRKRIPHTSGKTVNVSDSESGGRKGENSTEQAIVKAISESRDSDDSCSASFMGNASITVTQPIVIDTAAGENEEEDAALAGLPDFSPTLKVDRFNTPHDNTF